MTTASSRRIPFDRHYAQINDLSLSYFDVGEGTPIVFIPGWTFTAEVFEHQLTDLSQRFRIIALDPRSHGQSSITISNNTYPQIAKDTLHLLDHLNIEKCAIAGWSAGAMAAYSFFDQFGSDRMSHFVSIDQSPKSSSEDDRDWSIGNFDAWNGLYQIMTGDRFEHTRGFCDWLTQDDQSDDDTEWLMTQSLGMQAGIATNFLMDLYFNNSIPIAQKMGDVIPCLNVVRAENEEIAASMMERYSIKSSMEYFGAHMMFWEEKDKFNQIMADFITS